MEKAQCHTIRNKLFKIGALVKASTRRILVSMAGGYPYEHIFNAAYNIHCSMDALDWIALVYSHIPDLNEQTVRYCGRFSNAARRKRRKQAIGYPAADETAPVPEPDSAVAQFARDRRRNWARLLGKICEVDPLTCPRCGNRMEIITFIKDAEAIRKILHHMGLGEKPTRSPPAQLFPEKLESFIQSLTPRQAQQIRASSDSLFWDEVPVFED